MTNDNPVTVSGLILTLALAVLAVAAYYFRLTPEEVGLWAAVLTAASAILHYWLSQKTTPQAKPTSTNGTPLILANTHQPTPEAEAAGRYLVVEGPSGTTVAEAREGMRGRLVWNK